MPTRDIKVFKTIFILGVLVSCFSGFTANAEVQVEKILHSAKSWQVTYREWSDGLQQCVAENIQDEQVEFDLVVQTASISFAIYIGVDASEKEKEIFTFQIDDYAPWSSETPVFENGWLILELFNISEKSFSEIESQFRKGKNFKQLDADGALINTFSLAGSKVAIDALESCMEDYLEGNPQTSNSEPKEMLMGLPNKNFEIGFRNDNDEFLMTEYVPIGETVENWSQMITIQSLIDYHPINLSTFATNFIHRVIDQCSSSDQDIIWTRDQYGYDTLILVISCYINEQTRLPEHILV